MIRMRASDIATSLGGRLLGDDVMIAGIAHDSRVSDAQALFVALRGERHDGHEFIGPQLPAAALLVDHVVQDSRPMILVDDTLSALARLAVVWRQSCAARVIALTGSNGKTTTKEMLRAILSRESRVHATAGNLNNHIGVPLTLLALPQDMPFAVIEMGANHAGEIAALTRIAQPDVALITNAGRAHLEGFGSLEGVARAKGEIFSGLAESGIAVVNRDDRFADYWLQLNSGRRVIGFSLTGNAPGADDVTGIWHAPDAMELRWRDCHGQIHLAAPGRHLAQNAAAAAAAALAIGCGFETVCAGLRDWSPAGSRMVPLVHASGARIWDDTYNANPESLLAALDVLLAASGESVLVLGDMHELGADAAALHREMGHLASARGVTRLFAIGALTREAVDAFGPAGQWFSDHDALAAAVEASLHEGVTVLIKGSRGQRMERVIAALQLQRTAEEVAIASAAH
jgi:UDP-N-acetylmuramoyl-tripeptide--D-alanyl-D-alanine ligase